MKIHTHIVNNCSAFIDCHIYVFTWGRRGINTRKVVTEKCMGDRGSICNVRVYVECQGMFGMSGGSAWNGMGVFEILGEWISGESVCNV
ncbi:hypothetical protein MHBO_003564 [Bonamia ostreae]|uniref:Uncharacterized protein n=1 Tax=Bonamia ostreae TaxID=126728 RepID=A0ABV2ARE9_9EUKA